MIEEKEKAFGEWLADRPEIIQQLGARLKPWNWYKLTTDHDPDFTRYRVVSFSEDGTVMLTRYAVATGEAMWQVFGINPDSLVEADSPEEARAKLSVDEVAVGELAAAAQMAHLNEATRR